MRGAIPPLPDTSSWRGAQLKRDTGTTLPLYFRNSIFRHRLDASGSGCPVTGSCETLGSIKDGEFLD
jgi:hypothetical protein